jgi:hypothetical protein
MSKGLEAMLSKWYLHSTCNNNSYLQKPNKGFNISGVNHKEWIREMRCFAQ